ncbi:MAG: hypothetical protein GEU90_00445 [Gemmatimonas sp.]|nr:hypothetical protein [Gemmatimonas sp.]
MLRMVSMRDLRNTPGRFWKTLKREGAVVLAVNGVPKAVVLSVPDGDLETVVKLATRVRAQQATEAARRISRERGTDRLTLEEIDQEVREARRALREGAEDE